MTSQREEAMVSHQYFQILHDILDKVECTQGESMRHAAERLVDTVTGGGKAYFFGCTHAGILSQEAFYRTGGLAVINPIFPKGLQCDTVPITDTSALERKDGYGRDIAISIGFKQGDMLFVHSVSGRNAVPVELALEAGKMGVFVVAITSLEYSRQSEPRGSSGKRLFEASDLTIDNCGCFGDAALSLDGFPQKVSPTSTAIGAAIVNAIVAEATELFLIRGQVPPVFISANIEGGDRHNEALMKQYRKQIDYLG
jgi:uncharacterized phosphosugar-binding protein